MPFAEQIQASFGPKYSLAGIDASVGGSAGQAAERMGASGFASGNRVGFSGSPDLHTAAHEAAHVFQQQKGIMGSGEQGGSDPAERHADRVADAVVRGEDATPLLDQMTGRSGAGVGLQLKRNTEGGNKPVTGLTHGDLLSKLEGYQEAPEEVDNAFDVFAAFLSNDEAVPDKIKFGPSHPMTRTVQGDGGVAEARAAYQTGGESRYMYKFSALEFLRETVEMSLTSHFLGSYTVWMAPTGDGRVFFLVQNSTTRQSAARNPLPPEYRPEDGMLSEENILGWESGRREEPGMDWGGSIDQLFYWYEDEKTLKSTAVESSRFGDVVPSAEGEAWDQRDNLETGLMAGIPAAGALLGGLGGFLPGPAGALFGGLGGGLVGGAMGMTAGAAAGGGLGGAIGGLFGETGEQWGDTIGSAIGGGLGLIGGAIGGGLLGGAAGGLTSGPMTGGLGALLGGGLGLIGGVGLGNMFGDPERKDSLPQSIVDSGGKVLSALWDLF